MKRNQLLIGGAAVLAVVLLWYFVIYAPLGDDLSSAQTQTSTEQKTTDSLETDLARLQATQGQPLEARKVLEPVYDFFTGGDDFADVREARAVLAGLDR